MRYSALPCTLSLILETKIVLSPCRFLMTSALTSDNQLRRASHTHTSNTPQVIFTLGVWHTQGRWGEENEFVLNRGISVIFSGGFCWLLLCLSSGRSQEEGRKKKGTKLEWIQVQGGKNRASIRQAGHRTCQDGPWLHWCVLWESCQVLFHNYGLLRVWQGLYACSLLLLMEYKWIK